LVIIAGFVIAAGIGGFVVPAAAAIAGICFDGYAFPLLIVLAVIGAIVVALVFGLVGLIVSRATQSVVVLVAISEILTGMFLFVGSGLWFRYLLHTAELPNKTSLLTPDPPPVPAVMTATT